MLIVVLACFSYGALFLLAGLFFKNPMVPAVVFLGWELLTPFLPQLLKSLSLVHYLVSFTPVPVTVAAFAILAQPGGVVGRALGVDGGDGDPRVARLAGRRKTGDQLLGRLRKRPSPS